MKANLQVERIGGDYVGFDPLAHGERRKLEAIVAYKLRGTKTTHRDWVAEIKGKDSRYGYERVFVNGIADYTYANGKGTRGVYINYVLDDGRIYEVSEPITWKETDRYFCKVVSGEIIKITEREVEKWLRKH